MFMIICYMLVCCTFYVLSLNTVSKHQGPYDWSPAMGISAAGLSGGCAFASLSDSLFCLGPPAVHGAGPVWPPVGSARADAIAVLLDI